MNDQTNAHSQTEDSEIVESNELVVQDEAKTTEEARIPKSRLDKVISQRDEALEVVGATKTEIENLRREMQELKQSMSKQSSSNPDDEVFTDEETKALNRILVGLKNKGGIVTREDLEVTQRAQQRASLIKDLKKEYDGKNGAPKFDEVEVMEYAKANGFGDNLEAAYKLMHFSALARAEAKRQNIETVESEAPTGGARDITGDLDPNKIASMTPQEWSKKKDTVMEKFRNSIFGK